MAQQQQLMHDIETLETFTSHQQEDELASAELSKKRADLEKIIEHDTEGAFIRSRAKF